MKLHLQHVAKYYKQERVADVDVVIKVCAEQQQLAGTVKQQPGDQPSRDHAAEECLAHFPAHRLALFGAEYFEAQAQEAWSEGAAGDSSDAAATAATASIRPKLHLTIDSAEQLPAAEAVIAALYGMVDVLRSLKLQQLVDAVVIADRIGARAVVEQAVLDLTHAVSAENPTEVVAALSVLPAWPVCLQAVLLPVLQRVDLSEMPAADVIRVQHMLLTVLGDLEAAWADNQLQKLLLQLPLPMLALLLSAEQLQVASEDTVLYTASQYVEAQQIGDQRTAAKAALAALIRAPHLSGSCLAGQTFCNDPNLLLGGYSTQLKLLASHKLATSCGFVPAFVLTHISAAPASWLLGCRQLVPTDGVRLVWRLPVEQLAQACRDSFAGNTAVGLSSPSSSPPLGGSSWELQLECTQQERDGVRGSVIGVYVWAKEAFEGVLRMFSCTLTISSTTQHVPSCGALEGAEFTHFFTLEPMSAGGGWDEAAWAAKGLPTSGELELSLHMHSVGA